MMELPPPLPVAAIIERLVECGYPQPAIRIEYEEGLQSEVIYLDRPVGEPAGTFDCVRAAARSMYAVDVQFSDREVNDAYHLFDNERGREETRLNSREWLRTRGLLDRIPLYDPAQLGLPAFLNQLEKFCGYESSTALELYGTDLITMKPSALSFPINNDESAKFECLMHVLSATNIEEHGLSFGFIGNEQYRETEPE